MPLDRPFDAKALPHAAAYVASLPHGLDSFPECRVRTVVNQFIAERHPEVFRHPGIPASFRTLAAERARRLDWVPEVVGITARLLVRDIVHRSDTEYYAWMYDLASEVFSRPFYRTLWYVMSPTLVLTGASKRWNTLREGTTLTATNHARGGELTLRYPPGMYLRMSLLGFSEAFRASLVASRAKHPEVQLDDREPGIARWKLGWR